MSERNHNIGNADRTALDFDLSLGCAVAAAEARRLAEILVSTPTPRTKEFIARPNGGVIELVQPHAYEEDFIAVTPLGYRFDSIQPVELAVATKVQAKYSSGVRALLGAPTEKERASEDPMLVARIGDGMLLPLAMFNRRPGDYCDYVQVGSEMRTNKAADEAVISSPQDVTLPRFKVVTAIENALPEGDTLGMMTDEQEAAIQALIAEETALHAESIDRVIESRVCQDLVQKAEQGEPRILQMISGEGRVYEESATLFKIQSETFSDGRMVEYLVGKEATASLHKLYAVARRQVAIELAVLNPDLGTIEFTGPAGEAMNSVDARRRIFNQLSVQKGVPVTVEGLLETPPQFAFMKNNNHIRNLQHVIPNERLIAQYCYKRGLLSRDELLLDSNSRENLSSEQKTKLRAYLDDPGTNENPFQGSQILPLVLYRHQKFQASKPSYLAPRFEADLQLRDRFEQALGAYSPEEESLLAKVQVMQRSYSEASSVTVPNTDFGRGVRGPAVFDLHIAQNSPTEYQVVVKSVPVSMQDSPERTILANELMDLAGPVLDRSQGQEAVTEKAGYILSLLEKIASTHQTAEKFSDDGPEMPFLRGLIRKLLS